MFSVQTLSERPSRESTGGQIFLRIALFKTQLSLQTVRSPAYSQHLSPHILELDSPCGPASGNMRIPPQGFHGLTVAFRSPQRLIGRSCHPSYHRVRRAPECILRRPIWPVGLTGGSVIPTRWKHTAGTFAKSSLRGQRLPDFPHYFLSRFPDLRPESVEPFLAEYIPISLEVCPDLSGPKIGHPRATPVNPTL